MSEVAAISRVLSPPLYRIRCCQLEATMSGVERYIERKDKAIGRIYIYALYHMTIIQHLHNMRPASSDQPERCRIISLLRDIYHASCGF